jgi:ATP-dependent DNA ligase
VAFDLLYLNGRDLRKLPLFQRKAELKKILNGTGIQFSESFEIDGREMFAHACKLGLEGVVSKVRAGAYPTGRTNDWVKKTCAQRETLTIAGFALDGTKWDGLYVGRRKGDDLVYAGKVDHGFDKVSAADLQKRLKPLIRRTQPYAKRIGHKGIWVEPKLLAEIEYRASRPRERSGTRSSGACGRTCDGCVRSLLAMGGQAAGKFADNSGRATSSGHGARFGGPTGPRRGEPSSSARARSRTMKA